MRVVSKITPSFVNRGLRVTVNIEIGGAGGVRAPSLLYARWAFFSKTPESTRAPLSSLGTSGATRISDLGALAAAARRRPIQRAKGETEVHIEDVMNAARVTDVSPPTASRHFRKHLGVNWRLPRAEPLRTEDDVAARVDMRAKWKHLPNDFFTDRVDAIIAHARGVRAPARLPGLARARPLRKRRYTTARTARLHVRSFSADAPSGRGVFCLSRPVCARRLSPPGRLAAFSASAQN